MHRTDSLLNILCNTVVDVLENDIYRKHGPLAMVLMLQIVVLLLELIFEGVSEDFLGQTLSASCTLWEQIVRAERVWCEINSQMSD